MSWVLNFRVRYPHRSSRDSENANKHSSPERVDPDEGCCQIHAKKKNRNEKQADRIVVDNILKRSLALLGGWLTHFSAVRTQNSDR